jgi:hypothetical protein
LVFSAADMPTSEATGISVTLAPPGPHLHDHGGALLSGNTVHLCAILWGQQLPPA